jgi:hypothetical protein
MWFKKRTNSPGKMVSSISGVTTVTSAKPVYYSSNSKVTCWNWVSPKHNSKYIIHFILQGMTKYHHMQGALVTNKHLDFIASSIDRQCFYLAIFSCSWPERRGEKERGELKEDTTNEQGYKTLGSKNCLLTLSMMGSTAINEATSLVFVGGGLSQKD